MAVCSTVGADELGKMETLGKSVFFDRSLSARGNMACATCHEPAQGFTSAQADINAGGAVVEGSVPGRFGNRKPPSAAYSSFSPVLSHVVDEGRVVFVGGLFLDGRATGMKLGTPIADQAQGPFLNPAEMANPGPSCVVWRVLNPADPSAYPVKFADVWGGELADIRFPADMAAACANPDKAAEMPDEATTEAVEKAFDRIALSLSAFERSAEVNRFSSRYDKWLKGQAKLSDQELAGLKVFEAEDKGNCAACHVLTANTQGGGTVLTDWTYDNIGVPRNRDNPYYRAAENEEGSKWIDPGLAATLEADPVFKPYAEENFARQQVPTLRNLNRRFADGAPKAYMHNGYFKTLEGVVSFYNTRDVLPRCADSSASEAEAMAAKCWPAPEYEATVNRDELGNLKLSPQEEAELVAFLKTLDDE